MMINEVLNNKTVIKLGKGLNRLINERDLSLKEKFIIDGEIKAYEHMWGIEFLSELINKIVSIYFKRYRNALISPEELTDLLGQDMRFNVVKKIEE